MRSRKQENSPEKYTADATRAAVRLTFIMPAGNA